MRPLNHRLFVVSASLVLALPHAGCAARVDGEPLGHGYTRDADHILFEGQRIDRAGKHDIAEFAKAVGHPLELSHDVHAESFIALNTEYSKDKHRAYYRWISPGRFWVVVLPQADVATFKAVNFAHAVDKNAIWYLDRPIKGSDPATLRLLDNRVVKDSKWVYISGQAQRHLDAKSFRRVGSAYYIDANGVYWGSEPVAGADPATFKVLEDSFMAVDQNSVFRSGQRQPHLDAATCKFILDDPYGYQIVSDKNGVYLNGLKFLHADPSDFKVHDKRTAIGGKFAFLVDTWHCTPVTVYKEDGRLMTETVLYEKNSKNALAIVKAEVDGKSLKNLTLSAPPGKAAAGQVPDWQIDVFRREDMIKRMNQAGKLLK